MRLQINTTLQELKRVRNKNAISVARIDKRFRIQALTGANAVIHPHTQYMWATSWHWHNDLHNLERLKVRQLPGKRKPKKARALHGAACAPKRIENPR